MEDGVNSVMVPDEVFHNPSPLWEDFLIGRFLATAPHVAKVHAIVNKIWALGDKSQMIDVLVINSTTMKFRVCNTNTRNRVTRRGMWNLAGIPVVMSQWSPFTEETIQEIKSVPIWVHLRNVPMDMFTWKGLSFVTSAVGEPVRLHSDTAQCLDFKVAKIFVNADLTKELPKSMKFTSPEGKTAIVEYSYPWLPSRCSVCQKWGHLNEACTTKVDSVKLAQNQQTPTMVNLGNVETEIVVVVEDLENKKQVAQEEEVTHETA